MRLKRFWAGLLLIYTFYIIYGTLFPFLFPGFTGGRAFLDFSQWKKVFLAFPDFTPGDFLQNILLFIPFGYFWGRFLVRTSIKAKYGIFLVILFAFTISYSVEFVQLVTHNRFTSFFDVLFNVGGAGVGFALSKYIPSLSILILARRKIRPYVSTRWALPTLAAFFLFLLETWQPFNFSLVMQTPIAKMKGFWGINFNWSIENWIFSLRYGLLVSMVTSFGCAWMYEIGLQKFYRRVFAAVLILGVLIESTQFFIISRIPSPFEYLIILMGALFGLGLFKYIPQKEKITRLVFWILVGSLGALLNTIPLSGSIDSNQVNNFIGDGSFPISFRFNMGLHYLLIFFFIGFLITYFAYRYSLMKMDALYNSAVCGLSFFITMLSIQDWEFLMTWKRAVPIYGGLVLGIGLFIWLTVSFKSIYKKNPDPK